jgi:hypothetical protein
MSPATHFGGAAASEAADQRFASRQTIRATTSTTTAATIAHWSRIA